ncbi:uncharacterized protein LOC125823334 [Solanum verrucosum]|uniref:uncharacterized protein LOC125823334 n=1 Tax=Solanum verrucosum TaxID=315347 RepID=UPI0020D1B43A|nr:uncharacterized protein LOC125823334 [Solanum verrucosum]
MGTVELSHHSSVVMANNLAPKREVLGVFTVSCTIRMYLFNKALCDHGASMNLMPLVIFKKLCLVTPKPTSMRFLMVDLFIKLVGILFNILVKVNKSIILSTEFVVLDCDVDIEVPIILDQSFLVTERAFIDVDLGELKFRVGNDEVTFDVCKLIKPQDKCRMVSVIESMNKLVEGSCEEVVPPDIGRKMRVVRRY